MCNKALPLVIAFIICCGSTLYPTFKYGEKRAAYLRDTAQTPVKRWYAQDILYEADKAISVKRAFLLNPAEDRRIVVDQLVLEYAVAVLIGGIIYALQRAGCDEQTTRK